MSKQKQKEQLSLMIAKTVLAIAVITGLGIIIFGGGVVIMKYYNNEVNDKIVEPVDQETKNYYDVLEKKCGGDGCCLNAIEFMQENNYKEANENGDCPEGFYRVVEHCEHLLRWCVPIEESYCIDEQNNRRELGEILSESPTIFTRCDRFGNISTNYILSCGSEKLVISNGFGVIDRETPSESFSISGEGTLGFTWTIDNSKHKTFSGGPGTFFASCDNEKAAIFYSHLVEMGSNDYAYNKKFFDGNSVVEISCSYQEEISGVISKFEDSKRIYDFKPIENEKEICQEIKEKYQELEETVIDISHWQTYRNEEFGFEVKYPEEWFVAKGPSGDDIHFKERERKENNCNIFINDRNDKTVEQLLSANQSRYIDVQNIVIDSTNGVIASDIFTIGNDYKVAIFPHKDLMFFVGCEELSINELDQILSTFKFIEN